MKMFMIILKNSVRHKLRFFLTVLGISIAVMAFGLMRTVITAWNVGVEASAADRLIVRQAASFILPLPYAYLEEIHRVPNVSKVTWLNWFGGVYIDKNQFFARMACDPATLLDVYPEFVTDPNEYATFSKERNACMIGSALAKQYNLKIGDVMPIDGDIFPGKWEFVVRAIYKPRDKTVDATQMFFHWDYMNESVKQTTPERAGHIGWFVVKVSDPAQSGSVSKNIDALFANSQAETKTETERAFQQGFLSASGVILTAINVVSFVIIGIIMLVLGNTMIMSARERTREYAVLKTIGYAGKHLIFFIVGESLLVSFLGAVLGIALLVPMVTSFELFMPKGWFPIFYIAPITYVLAASSAMSVGILAAIIPIRRVVSTRIVDGLRFIG